MDAKSNLVEQTAELLPWEPSKRASLRAPASDLHDDRFGSTAIRHIDDDENDRGGWDPGID